MGGRPQHRIVAGMPGDWQRRRRYYKLTPEGRKVLAAQRSTWESFVAAINRVTRPEHA